MARRIGVRKNRNGANHIKTRKKIIKKTKDARIPNSD